ncbi:hypothetical protein D477_010025 [Arthrobacter crystallopoietes BAB-32]|uniref:Uncharacterized protein n=2 Tax=Crystallibacter crystallopoietes TaxID=37928 RepID=N1V2U4_9MICC|nr:hypothetical protein D477_010025 [Arthrobacter crystallopoietes BAB-32]
MVMLRSAIKHAVRKARRTAARVRGKVLLPNYAQLPSDESVLATDASIADGLTVTVGGYLPGGDSRDVSSLWFESSSGHRFECVFQHDGARSNRWQASAELPVREVLTDEKTWKAFALVGTTVRTVSLQEKPASTSRAAVSPESGHVWSVEGLSQELLLKGKPPASKWYVDNLTVRLGSIVCSVRAQGMAPEQAELLIRKRKTDSRIRIPLATSRGLGEARIFGSEILARDPEAQAGQPVVWDVWMGHEEAEPYRVRSSAADIDNPRRVFRYATTPFYFEGRRGLLRPYWTLDGYLSLEVRSGTVPAQAEGTGK